MNQVADTEDRKLSLAMHRFQELKEQKKTAKLTVHTDKGRVNAAKVEEDF
jgi:hypothetical protein